MTMVFAVRSVGYGLWGGAGAGWLWVRASSRACVHRQDGGSCGDSTTPSVDGNLWSQHILNGLMARGSGALRNACT